MSDTRDRLIDHEPDDREKLGDGDSDFEGHKLDNDKGDRQKLDNDKGDREHLGGGDSDFEGHKLGDGEG